MSVPLVFGQLDHSLTDYCHYSCYEGSQLAPDFCELPLRAVSLQVALFVGSPTLPLLSPALIVAQRLSWVHLPVYRRSEECPMSQEEMTDYGRSDGTMR